MRVPSLLFVVTAGGYLAAQQPALRVLRVVPERDAEPTTTVSVVFDRPVAGSLEGAVDLHTIFAIVPAVDGTLEWRDPVTLRFSPARPLAPGARYTVTVANTFTAMDGSRLARPYEFTFRVTGPRVLAGLPVGPNTEPQYLAADASFELVVSGPADLDQVGHLVHVEFENGCRGPSVVRLRALSQRAITDDDPWQYTQAGGWQRDRSLDAQRRVVRLRPEQPLPLACRGSLVVPPTLDPQVTRPSLRWRFATHGPFRLIAARCGTHPWCPTGFATLEFSTPVRGADVERAVRLEPAVRFAVPDTSDERARWILEAGLKPRTTYRVSVDSTLYDVFGQALTGATSDSFATTGYAPSIGYATGLMLVERQAFRTLAVTHVNADTLAVTLAAVPESLEAVVLGTPAWRLQQLWPGLAGAATTRLVPVPGRTDVPLVSAVKVPAYNAARPRAPALSMMRVTRPRADTAEWNRSGLVVAQVTDLGVAARIGAEDGVVWVTGVNDGLPRAGAAVTLYDAAGRVRARSTTDAQGVARLGGFAPADTTAAQERNRFGQDFQGYVAAKLGSDRALVPLNAYGWELSPWRFNVESAWGAARIPVAGAVFTERGIYRPGEVVHAKAIVRTGLLGALRTPRPTDSLRWVFQDLERGALLDTVVRPSSFGTDAEVLPLARDLPLGTYGIAVEMRRQGAWVEVAQTTYRVVEYRPPEFLVHVGADSAARFAGDSLRTSVESRYLFGAPMARAAVSWMLQQESTDASALNIPGVAGYYLGESGWWWENDAESEGRTRVAASGADTLDGTGRLNLSLALPSLTQGRPARVTFQATVTDVNRQTVSASTSVLVHPAAFYLAAKPLGASYFWKAGTPQEIALLAVRPTGERVGGVAIRGTVVRREWHHVQRERGGLQEQVGEWVADTVAHCDLTSGAEPAVCRFTPPAGGSYVLSFVARDTLARRVSTSFYRWATGGDWVPWNDDSQFKMDVIPDRERYDVGDTATVLFASPFTNVEALITVEREGVIATRRVHIASGSLSLKFPISEAYVPNAYVSVVVARGRSAPPGGIGDPGRPTIRVGYAQLRVTPDVKRLQVAVQPERAEYRPGDSVRVRLDVRDAAGAGRRSEVTLWAVDEGVLALTGYRTPDPVELIYRPRGVGLTLGSDLTSVAEQVVANENVSIKGEQNPGGGGGVGGSEVLRSRFAATAFFLSSVVTDAAGQAVAAAKLPDNLTTFRVMAVAVTAGDRYGSGQSTMLVTRPLLARPALPRFLRRDDRFTAGVVVNQRAGGTPLVRVTAKARGVASDGPAVRSVTLAPGRGSEVRFAFRDTTADTTVFRFDVASGSDSDAVLIGLPVRPAYAVRAHTVAGVLRDSASAVLTLPGEIDPARSRLTLTLATTPLAVVGDLYRRLAAYPFDCSEQLSGSLLTLAALQRAGTAPDGRRYAPARSRAAMERMAASLVRRQRGDGGIGFWGADDWTTPWLSAYAGNALLAARAAGVSVSDSVLARLGNYLFQSFHRPGTVLAPVAGWYAQLQVRLSDRVAALDYLSRLGRPDVSGENEALIFSAQLAWEDRARLAEILTRRGATDAARRLLTGLWSSVHVAGRRAVLPDSATRPFYFFSARRPAAQLLSATLAVDSANPLVGPLVETLAEEGRAAAQSAWNTQDYGTAAEALALFAARQRRALQRGVTVTANGQVVLGATAVGARDSSRDLTALLRDGPQGSKLLPLTLAAGPGPANPIYYSLTVHEVPLRRPVTPDDQGIQVERWYEDYQTGKPIDEVTEGALVRVRLRIKVAEERHFLALTDPLPAGLEAVDLTLRTVGRLPVSGIAPREPEQHEETQGEQAGYRYGWYYGSWDSGWWSPFDHKELRDDRVVYAATVLWPGTYTATYVARATTPGVFVRPPAYAEEMYNPAVQGRSDGGIFTVHAKQP